MSNLSVFYKKKHPKRYITGRFVIFSIASPRERTNSYLYGYKWKNNFYEHRLHEYKYSREMYSV